MTSEVCVQNVEVSEVEVGEVEKTVKYLPLDSRKCPICQSLQAKRQKALEVAEKLGLDSPKIPKYCTFHYKLLQIFKIKKTPNAERIFNVNTSEKSINVVFGYKNNEAKATILVVIPKKTTKDGKRTVSVVAGGKLFNNIDPSILNLFEPTELDIIMSFFDDR